MSIKIVPHSAELSDAVEEFNRRMHENGSKWGFYVSPEPQWIPRQKDSPAWREYYLAVEDGEHVRGAYALKPQLWYIRGEIEWITDWQGPFTEGAIDRRYATLALRLIRDMLKKYPLLFSLGHGGSDEPIVHLLRSLKWTLHETPVCLKVIKPYRFLRFNAYLRKSTARRMVLDALAYTGLGSLGIHSLQAFNAVRAPGRAGRVEATIVESFGEWADVLWTKHRASYTCLAVRDRRMMNTLLPAEGWPGGIRLKVSRGDTVIGWAVVHEKKMQADPRFGSLHVGLISDCFGAPDDAPAIVAAAHCFLEERDVDLVFSNQSHWAWVAGFRSAGYIVLENKRSFAISPSLRARLEPFEEVVEGLHLTNMDGHGPHGFS